MIPLSDLTQGLLHGKKWERHIGQKGLTLLRRRSLQCEPLMIAEWHRWRRPACDRRFALLGHLQLHPSTHRECAHVVRFSERKKRTRGALGNEGTDRLNLFRRDGRNFARATNYSEK